MPAAFILLWALWSVLFLPGAIIGLAGGALFGPLWGVPWNLTGATLGASLAFLARLVRRLRGSSRPGIGRRRTIMSALPGSAAPPGRVDMIVHPSGRPDAPPSGGLASGAMVFDRHIVPRRILPPD